MGLLLVAAAAEMETAVGWLDEVHALVAEAAATYCPSLPIVANEVSRAELEAFCGGETGAAPSAIAQQPLEAHDDDDDDVATTEPDPASFARKLSRHETSGSI